MPKESKGGGPSSDPRLSVDGGEPRSKYALKLAKREAQHDGNSRPASTESERSGTVVEVPVELVMAVVTECFFGRGYVLCEIDDACYAGALVYVPLDVVRRYSRTRWIKVGQVLQCEIEKRESKVLRARKIVSVG